MLSYKPRYLAYLEWEIAEFFKETSGQSFGLRVKVMCVDFSLFTFIAPLCMLRWFWGRRLQFSGLRSEAKMAVTSL
jgi:hypothetical protein